MLYDRFASPPNVFATNTERDKCPDVDISDRFGPVRSQGNSYSCFAFVTADLIGFNQGLAHGKQVSALDVQLGTITNDPKKILDQVDHVGNWDTSLWAATSVIPKMNEDRKRNFGTPLWQRFAEGGTPSVTMLSYNASGGICLEDKLPSEGKRAFIDTDDYLGKTLGQFNTYSTRPLPRGRLLEARESCPDFDLRSPARTDARRIQEKAALELAKSISARCGPRLPMKPMDAQVIRVERGKESSTGKIVAAALAAGVPLGIGYDSTFLAKGPSTPVAAADHASLIVGLRWNKKDGRCEYKLRNSFGISCDPYHPEIKKDCHGGQIWISEEQVNQRVQTIFGITPQTD